MAGRSPLGCASRDTSLFQGFAARPSVIPEIEDNSASDQPGELDPRIIELITTQQRELLRETRSELVQQFRDLVAAELTAHDSEPVDFLAD